MEINLRANQQFSSKINEGKREELTRQVGRLLGFKMLNDAMNNLEINLLEGPDSVVNFPRPIKFDEHLSLPPGSNLATTLVIKITTSFFTYPCEKWQEASHAVFNPRVICNSGCRLFAWNTVCSSRGQH
jgi:hypothetical protein